MRTAVTIPDTTFEAAERLAEQLGLSRGELYARALSDFMRTQNGRPEMDRASDAELTRQINEGLVRAGRDASELDDAWKAARNRALAKDDW